MEGAGWRILQSEQVMEFWLAVSVTGWSRVEVTIRTLSEAGCRSVIQKDIEVTQDLRLGIKTLTCAQVFVRCGGTHWDCSCLWGEMGYSWIVWAWKTACFTGQWPRECWCPIGLVLVLFCFVFSLNEAPVLYKTLIDTGKSPHAAKVESRRRQVPQTMEHTEFWLVCVSGLV